MKRKNIVTAFKSSADTCVVPLLKRDFTSFVKDIKVLLTLNIKRSQMDNLIWYAENKPPLCYYLACDASAPFAPRCAWLCDSLLVWGVDTFGFPVPAWRRGWLCNWRCTSPQANTACCLTWFGSIKEANRLLTSASIPRRISHAYKNPFRQPVINTGLIIVSRSAVLKPATPQSQVSFNLNGNKDMCTQGSDWGR